MQVHSHVLYSILPFFNSELMPISQCLIIVVQGQLKNSTNIIWSQIVIHQVFIFFTLNYSICGILCFYITFRFALLWLYEKFMDILMSILLNLQTAFGSVAIWIWWHEQEISLGFLVSQFLNISSVFLHQVVICISCISLFSDLLVNKI